MNLQPRSLAMTLTCVLACLATSNRCWLTPVPLNFVNNTSDVFFPASANDLIDQSEPTFLSEVSAGHTSFAGSTTANLNNGTVGASGSNPDLAFDLDGAWTSTFNLDLTAAPLGYNITQVNSYSGWATTNYGHQYELFLSTVGNAGFTSLGIFTNNPPATGSLHSALIQITDTTGRLGTGIDAIRFDFTNPGPPSGTGGMREVDVFGSATNLIPEPATWLLLGLGSVGLATLRRRPT